MKLYRKNMVDAGVYEANYNNWFAGLNTFVQSVVWDYTESGYKALNLHLRGLLEDATGELKHKAETLEAALKGSAGLHDSTTLFRGVKALEELPEVGGVMSFDAFTSTTSDPHQIFKFVDEANPIIFEITTTQAQEISYLHDEFEFLMTCGAKFNVTAVHRNVEWHAEYGDTGYSKSLSSAVVVQLTQI